MDGARTCRAEGRLAAGESSISVKHRRPLTKLAEKDALIVQLGRDVLSKHKVSSDLFARAEKQFGKQGSSTSLR
jgi:hypothetical protein